MRQMVDFDMLYFDQSFPLESELNSTDSQADFT
jgi:hypothetical protein